MSMEEYFWKASVNELKKGYLYDLESEASICLVCGKKYERGIVYPIDEKLYKAKRAIKIHIEKEHHSMFAFFLELDKKYTGLTEHQKELMTMFYRGYSDKEVAENTGAGNTSTIRNHRFSFREKYKQAKIIVAMMELLEEKKESNKMENQKFDKKYEDEEFVNIHRTATMTDERYAITQSERENTLQRYFNEENHLVVKTFPAKQKKKIIILQHLIKQFEPGKKYSENEVNDIIQKFYDDTATIRRYFIEYGFLDRTNDGRTYWVKQ